MTSKAFRKTWRQYRDRGQIGRRIRVAWSGGVVNTYGFKQIINLKTAISSSIHVAAI